ncbi:MAG: SLC13 family permease [Sphingobacteriales bacterium]|jgi:di/tricarboxylate transporter|nr:SLC13 family permease [Sphingobacteriales bacterium]
MYDPKILTVALVIPGMIFLLYKEIIKPVLVFVLAIIILLASGVISTQEALSGFSNEQIAVIFLLLLVSDLIKRSGALDMYVFRLFRSNLGYRHFLLRMGTVVSGVSAFVNNTPLVALMMPYAYDWARRKRISASKVLMPLSMSAIIGGTLTLIGTSTNLVVSGLAVSSGYEPLGMFAFTPIALPIVILVILYMVIFSNKLLPKRKDALTEFKEHTREYVIETKVPEGSIYAGKTLDDNKLRQLRGLYVVELIRGDRRIAPVSPRDVIQAGDILIFAGETDTVIDLMNNRRELVPADFADYPTTGRSDVVEAIVAPTSSLQNKPVNTTNFRQNFDAAIVAVNRDGEKISGKVGDIELRNGDLLLLLAGKEFYRRAEKSRDLFVVSKRRQINHADRSLVKWILLGLAAALALEAFDVISLLLSLMILTASVALAGFVSVEDVKKSLDLELMVMLGLSIGIGKSISNSGLDELFAHHVIEITGPLHPTIGVIIGLYLVANILTMFVTNAAAAAITFPIAVATAQQMGVSDLTPYFLTIAFAASADFLTPFGYQTNLMVYGPGGYRFQDYIRYGLLPTIICMTLVIAGIAYWYNLV